MEIEIIQNKIYQIRGQKVMLDSDLAELYGVETKVLNQAIKRNSTRFPEDFMFQLSDNEYINLRSQSVTSKMYNHGGRRYTPLVFTEQGVAMLSSVLNSEKAIQVNIAIMRAFVLIRQYYMNYKDLKEKVDALEQKYDAKLDDIYEAIDQMLSPENERKQIGFKQSNE